MTFAGENSWSTTGRVSPATAASSPRLPRWLPRPTPAVASVGSLVRHLAEDVVRAHAERSLTGVVAPVADASGVVRELVERMLKSNGRPTIGGKTHPSSRCWVVVDDCADADVSVPDTAFGRQ